MKKRILSILTTAAMLLISAMPFTASAANSSYVFENYTFEEVLAMTREDIAAISEEAAQMYDYGVYCHSTTSFMFNRDVMEMPFDIVFTEEFANAFIEENGSLEITFQEYAELLGVPLTAVADQDGASEIWELNYVKNNVWDGGYEHGIRCTDEYSGYSRADYFGTISAVLNMNPDIFTASILLPGAGGASDEAVLTGDFNSDGEVSVLDIVTLSKYTAQIVTANEVQIRAGDCNADGTLDSNDLTALMSYLVGLSESLPCTV